MKIRYNSIDLRYAFSKVLAFGTFILFIFGVLIEYDGISIMINSKHYRAGVLKGDSVIATPTAKSHQSTIYVIGDVNSVHTAIILGNTETFYTDSVLTVFTKQKSVLLPVWYRPDGEMTIARFKKEKEFPFWRVSKKTLLYFLFFCSPFILTLLWQARLRHKLHSQTPQASINEN